MASLEDMKHRRLSMGLFWRFISISIIVVVSATSAFCGCGKDMIEADDERLLAKYPLLNLDDPISIWWEGTQGESCFFMNVIYNQEIYKHEFFIRNNTEKPLDIALYKDSYNKIALTIEPFDIYSSYVEFIPAYRVLYDQFKRNEVLMFGGKGPKVSVKLNKEKVFKASIDSLIFVNDPDVDVFWGNIPNSTIMDVGESKPMKVIISNRSDETKNVALCTSRKKRNSVGRVRFDEKRFVLRPNKDLCLDYDIFKPFNKEESGFSDSFYIFLTIDEYQYSRKVLVSHYDCIDWIFQWPENSENKTLKLEIGIYETKSVKMMITNHCDRERVLIPNIIRNNNCIIKAEKENYYFKPNSTMQINLDVEFITDSNILESSDIEIDLLEMPKNKDDQNPLTITITPKISKRTNSRYKITLPEVMKSNNYMILSKPLNDRMIVTNAKQYEERYFSSYYFEDPLSIYCFDINTGEKLWYYHSNQKMVVACSFINNNYLLLNTINFDEAKDYYGLGTLSHLYCLDIRTGNKVWHKEQDHCLSCVITKNNELRYIQFNESHQRRVHCINLETGDTIYSRIFPEHANITDKPTDGYYYYFSQASDSTKQPSYNCDNSYPSSLNKPYSLKKYDITSNKIVKESELIYHEASVIVDSSEVDYDQILIYSNDVQYKYQETERIIYAYGCFVKHYTDCIGPCESSKIIGFACADKNDLSTIWDTILPHAINYSHNGEFYSVNDGFILVSENGYDKPFYKINVETGELDVVHEEDKGDDPKETTKFKSFEKTYVNDEDGNMIQSALRINKRDDNGNYIDDPICTLAFTKDEWFKLLGEKQKFRDMFHYDDFKIHYIDKDSILFMVGNTIIRYDAPE